MVLLEEAVSRRADAFSRVMAVADASTLFTVTDAGARRNQKFPMFTGGSGARARVWCCCPHERADAFALAEPLHSPRTTGEPLHILVECLCGELQSLDRREIGEDRLTEGFRHHLSLEPYPAIRAWLRAVESLLGLVPMARTEPGFGRLELLTVLVMFSKDYWRG